MTLIDALLIKLNHPIWTWKQCMYWARQERREAPPINWNHLIYGVCAVAAAVLIVAPWLTRAGCGV